MLDMPTIHIVYGPPGAGKSSLVASSGQQKLVQLIDEGRLVPSTSGTTGQGSAGGASGSAADLPFTERRSLIFETSKGDDALAMADRAYWLGYRVQSTVVAVQDPQILLARLAGGAILRHGEELVRAAMVDFASYLSKLVDRSDQCVLVDTSAADLHVQARFVRGALSEEARDRKPWALAEIERVEVRSLREEQALVRPDRADSGADSRGRKIDLESVGREAWSSLAVRQAWQQVERAAAPAFRNSADVLSLARHAYQVPFRAPMNVVDRAVAAGILRGRHGLLATNASKLERMTAQQASVEFRGSLGGFQTALERAAEAYIRDVQAQRERDLIGVPALSAEARSVAKSLVGAVSGSPAHAADKYRANMGLLSGPVGIELGRQLQAMYARFAPEQIEQIRQGGTAANVLPREIVDQLRLTLQASSLVSDVAPLQAMMMDGRARLRLSR